MTDIPAADVRIETAVLATLLITIQAVIAVVIVGEVVTEADISG